MDEVQITEDWQGFCLDKVSIIRDRGQPVGFKVNAKEFYLEDGMADAQIRDLRGFNVSSIPEGISLRILFATGIWQITPLKDRCLSKCVSPLGFFLLHGRKGLAGAFRMGAEHGYYCVGCCWMYMLVMLAVAAMSIPSMVLLASLITVEKAIVHGAMWFKWASAAIFITLGAAIILVPQLFIP